MLQIEPKEKKKKTYKQIEKKLWQKTKSSLHKKYFTGCLTHANVVLTQRRKQVLSMS